MNTRGKAIEIDTETSIEAITLDVRDALSMFNKKRVLIFDVESPPRDDETNRFIEMFNTPLWCEDKIIKRPSGVERRLVIIVKAPTYYVWVGSVKGVYDTSPKPCKYMVAVMDIKIGYPMGEYTDKPIAVSYYYHDADDASGGKRGCLASPNVFPSGHACIGTWKDGTSSIQSICEKICKDMIHDNTINNLSSLANQENDKAIKKWHLGKVEAGHFPTIPRIELFRQRAVLPPKRISKTTPPPLPGRRRAQ